MLFHSLEFAIFLPIVFILYWYIFKNNIKYQNIVLLIASYVFYGWWDYRFLTLIFFSSIVDYSVGLLLERHEKKNIRIVLLLVSVCVNIGLLMFFKYYNFFADNFVNAFTFLGYTPNVKSLNIILPVGISFYTFQTLSYTIDVYRKKLKPTKDIVSFFAYVSFFPQLVAGPIERATNLLPQFLNKRKFDNEKAVDGLRQILWGLFKKIVIADSCAVYVNQIFNNYQDMSGATLLLGGIFFAFQIYGDFSGYSDIAIGTARLFGFNLMKNFAFPYFSRDIAEFWRRWHISLSSWFRDYVYIPLGGSRVSTMKRIRNTLIIFIVSGFWHGARWTFVAWGVINALYFIPLMLSKKNRSNLEIVSKGRIIPNAKEFFQILLTFLLTVIAWVFFRSENMAMAFSYLGRMFSLSLFSIPEVLPISLLLILGLFIIIEWLQRDKEHALALNSDKLPKWFRYSSYYLIVLTILIHIGEKQEFIYFQF